ncbi:hypothetical protein HZZ13_32765 [Bradyrhizobium sp. CNPSo 4010]|uniref:Uncharacterized protein n=1 Tax=Bradyrhizobium agreste TaxID=2751811 RepID=A0ABS0PZC2_9BRAD|nr:hypothetical protein [Bradyrhizobium agreste]MBH5402528.1 hypothetical protein [Bradyrhizobium agreste]
MKMKGTRTTAATSELPDVAASGSTSSVSPRQWVGEEEIGEPSFAAHLPVSGDPRPSSPAASSIPVFSRCLGAVSIDRRMHHASLKSNSNGAIAQPVRMVSEHALIVMFAARRHHPKLNRTINSNTYNFDYIRKSN